MVWDISKATLVQSFSTIHQDTAPEGLYFKPDGSKMYIVLHSSADKLYEYDLTSNWDISTLTYLQTLTISDPIGVFFKEDGLKMYIIGFYTNALVEYDLSVAWDISTAIFLQDLDINSHVFIPHGIYFKPDGTKFFIVNPFALNIVSYNLSIAWDISTATFSESLSVSGISSFPHGIFFKIDGSKMYIGGIDGLIHEFDLSTDWNISTGVLLQNLDVSSEDMTIASLSFKEDGTKMYASGHLADKVFEYNLTVSKKRPKKSS